MSSGETCELMSQTKLGSNIELKMLRMTQEREHLNYATATAQWPC